MSLFAQFKTNEDLEKKGVLLDYGKTADGKDICIRVARAGGSNKAFDKRMESLTKPIRRQLQNETVDPAVLDTILRKVWAETVVLGWENVQGEDGKDIPFTVDNCVKLFTDLPELFADVQEQTRKSSLFRQANLELEGKN
jgi:hypothetical protein